MKRSQIDVRIILSQQAIVTFLMLAETVLIDKGAEFMKCHLGSILGSVIIIILVFK